MIWNVISNIDIKEQFNNRNQTVLVKYFQEIKCAIKESPKPSSLVKYFNGILISR